MTARGNVIFDFLDVSGKRLNDRMDVSLSHTVLADSHQKKDFKPSKRLKFTDLEAAEGGTYQVIAYPMQHRPVSRFIRVPEGKTVQESFVFPVDPERVSSVQFPRFDELGNDLQQILSNSLVEGNEDKKGADLYGALDAVRRAGLLNIYAKMKATRFENGRDVFAYVSSVLRIRGARFFATAQKELRDEVKNSIHSRLFQEVSGALHTPPPGFTLTDSFKTGDRYGNLQLTFFNRIGTLEFIIDADIDEAQGIDHIFQVVRNTLTGGDSHPYDIHEILMQSQKLDPGYVLLT
jgi:hypothetical protein